MKIDEFFSRSVLKGKVSIVTGAGKGLGKTMALALAQAGSDMVLVARNQEERAKRIPLGRFGSPEELGPVLIYLASDASNYVTGTTLFIDGGMVVG